MLCSRKSALWVAIFGLSLVSTSFGTRLSSAQEDFRRGDVDLDGHAGTIIDILGCSPFHPSTACDASRDVNGDGQINPADLASLVTYAVGDGTPPVAPGPDVCGPDGSLGPFTCSIPCPTPTSPAADPAKILSITQEFTATGSEVIARVLYTHDENTTGISFGVRHDPSLLTLIEVTSGSDLEAPTQGTYLANIITEYADGFTALVLYDQTASSASLSPGVDQELFTLRYTALASGVADLSLVEDMGSPEMKIRSAVGTSLGAPAVGWRPTTIDGSVSIDQVPLFRRGDPNVDGSVDIADPIGILTTLLGGGLPTTCQDAADANDDGTVNVADGVFLLSLLFGDTGTLPAPGFSCGPDLTDDSLSECVYSGCP